MSKRQLIALILIFCGLGIIASLAYIRFVRLAKPTAGLKIESVPAAVVFVNNAQVGRTPFDELLPPGEVTVRLVPESTSSAMAAYQTKVRLTNNVYTIIRREFGESESQSTGETITLSPYSGTQSALSVVTTEPESALVSVDGLSQGFSPINLTSLAASDHQIEVTSPGFAPRLVQAKTVNGFQLSVSVKLAARGSPPPPPSFPSPSPIATPSASQTGTPTPTPFPRPYVRILSTPTGFLRVRSTPSRAGAEIGQIKPGENYPLLDESESGGWYFIKLDTAATTSGWISSEYAQLFK